MPKLNNRPYRLLRFVLVLLFTTLVFYNITYGLQIFRNQTNEFIGATETTTEEPPKPEYADLTIIKTVRNSDNSGLTPAQQSQQFVFTVTFSGGGEYTLSIGGAEQLFRSGGTIILKHGQTAVIRKIQVGTTYIITETPHPDYTTGGSGHQGIIVKNGSKAEFINTAKPVATPPPTTTQPPATTQQPPVTTQPPTTQPSTYPPLTTAPPTQYSTAPPTTSPPATATTVPPPATTTQAITSPPTTSPPTIYTTQPTISSEEPTTPFTWEDLTEKPPPGDSHEFTDPSTTQGTIETPEPTPGPVIPTTSKDTPETGDEENDPRSWLILMAISAFILRYILFLYKINPEDPENKKNKKSYKYK